MRLLILLFIASCFCIPQAGLASPPATVAAPAKKVLCAGSHWPGNGSYRTPHGYLFVGRTGEPPNKPGLQYFDAATRRLGDLVCVAGNRYRTQDAPYRYFDLARPVVSVVEDRHVVTDAQGRFGFSVWHSPGTSRRPLIVLLEGADDSNRDMGFLIPYFAAHGMAVLTYDQRGTGVSTGNWRYTGPRDKADDVLAALASLAHDRSIDISKVGVWAPSNGGWVAPVVANRYPLAFVIFKSASSRTIADNVLYEIRQVLEQGNRFSASQINAAMTFERGMLRALTSNQWTGVAQALEQARLQPWFPLMRIPPGMKIPPPAPVLAALRASLIFDPTPELDKMTVPTLALFGAGDRGVDARSSAAGFTAAFAKSGMHDFTVHVFPHADHLLIFSKTGYESDEQEPERFAQGYPSIMIDWFKTRGLASGNAK